ncbi:hypothetical protein GCM10028784_06420 [Myceligenerans cantabricum]
MPAPAPDPDHAWKLLGLVNEWIRHSDAKAGVTLAFTGALGTMVFNLVKDFDHRTILFNTLAVLAATLLVLAAGLCAWTLTPRVNDVDAEPEAINRLFFGSITQNFKGTRRQYHDALAMLTVDPHELTKDLADQIHANAKIATVKASAVKRAIQAALAAGASVAALATIIGITSL